MAEVEWVQVSTGLIVKGEDELFKQGSGYVPVCWIEYQGTIFRSTLPSLRDAILRYTKSTVKVAKDASTDTVRKLSVIHNDDMEDINKLSDIINYWYNVKISADYGGIYELSYYTPTNWPTKKVWVGFGDIDEEDFIMPDVPGYPGGGGSPRRGGGPPGPAPPGPAPPGPPGPGPGPAPNPPPAFPGPEPFLGEGEGGEGGEPSSG